MLLLLLLFCSTSSPDAQTIKENIPPGTLQERSWWNLLHYEIDITPNSNNKSIKGSNTITLRALRPGNTIRIDLVNTMKISSVKWENVELNADSVANGWLIHFPRTLNADETAKIVIQFEGQPTEAVKPPFGQGGWIWTKDKLGRPWYSLACEGSGAMVWLPCKNTLYDEPDNGISFSITVPDTLVAVANGRLVKTTRAGQVITYVWKLISPINGYNICPSVGKYVGWHEDYKGAKGPLDCDYWVLDYNQPKAKKHFKAVGSLLACFEKWLGPYPFYEDSYKVIESPMAGMEHQSGIAYGNGFQDGYSGKNISGTPWSDRWDFILVHESGHEWFGNSLTSASYIDGWIHEGFTKYLEVIYTDEWFGTRAGNEYAAGIAKRIKNDAPVLGGNTSDQYYKSSAMLHIIRQITGDTIFRKMLHNLQREFYHSTINTAQVLNSMNKTSGKNFSLLFRQYLETTQVPVLEYKFEGAGLKYRWSNCIAAFDMPVRIAVNNGTPFLINPSTNWKTLTVKNATAHTLTADPAFYIQIKIAQ